MSYGKFLAEANKARLQKKSLTLFNPLDYGARYDGLSHPASAIGYASLAALQTDYPFALSLDDEMDVLGTQQAIVMMMALPTGGEIEWPGGRAVCVNNRTFDTSRTGGATSALMTANGAGYTSLPTAVGLPAGVTGKAIVEMNFVETIDVTNGGSGYSTAPTVTISGSGGNSSATATAVVSGGVVTAVNVVSKGTGYASAPSITFSGGGGSNAAATANLTGWVVDFVINTTGSNIQNGVYPCTFTGGGGSGATMDIRVSAYYTIELPPHSTNMPGIGNSSANAVPYVIRGAGYDITQIFFPVNPPYMGAIGIKCGRKWLGTSWSSDHRTFGNGTLSQNQAMYDMEFGDMTVFDSTFNVASSAKVPQQSTAAIGAKPSNWTLIACASRMRLHNIHIGGGFAGVDFVGDQSMWEYVVIERAYFNVYFSRGSSNQSGRQLYGDHSWHCVKLMQAKWANCGVAVGGAMLAIHLKSCGFFTSPFAIYKESGSVANTGEVIASNITFDSKFQFEQMGNAHIYEEPTNGVLMCSTQHIRMVAPQITWDNSFKYTGALPNRADNTTITGNYGRWGHFICGKWLGSNRVTDPNSSLINFANMDTAPPTAYLPNAGTSTFPCMFYGTDWEDFELSGVLQENNVPSTDNLFYNLGNQGNASGLSPGFIIGPWTNQKNVGKFRVKSSSWAGRLMQVARSTSSLVIGGLLEVETMSNGNIFAQTASNMSSRPIAGVCMQNAVFQMTPIAVATEGFGPTIQTTEGAPTIASEGTSALYTGSLSGGVLSLNCTRPGVGYLLGVPPTITVTGLSANNLTFTPLLDALGGIVEITIAGTNSSLTGTPVVTITGGTSAPYSAKLVKADLGKASHVVGAHITASLSGGVLTATVRYGGLGYTVAPTVTLYNITGNPVTLTATISGGVVTGVSVDGTNSGLFKTAPTLPINVYVEPPAVTRDQFFGDVVGFSSSTNSFARFRF